VRDLAAMDADRQASGDLEFYLSCNTMAAAFTRANYQVTEVRMVFQAPSR
jgi:hypothetical protein